MNDPPTKMGALGLRRATHVADLPRGLGRVGSFPRASPAAADAWSPAGTSGSPGGPHEDCGAEENLDSLSWVREKVLFLLHPERGLGTYGDTAQEEAAGAEDCSQAGGDDPECLSPHLPGEERVSGSRVDAHPGAPPRDTAAPPRSVLVRVVDFQATQEVLWTAWRKGCMTARTEERSTTVLTFRTNKE
ncbi:uncharacterized protein C6orf141 homolog [Saccopteryx bilineata]|uniref:uncharacterized protein C6orf141 homolog n=1 Tax=Saccopteryx bilineata TaxID=59482 RepID=UPI00338E1914